MTSALLNFLPHLPTSRLISYGTLTFGLSCFALWRYLRYYYDENSKSWGASVFEDIMKDNFIVVAAFNMVFCFLVTLVRSMQFFFFGSLRGTEPEFIREKLTQFLLSRAVFLIGIINATKWSSLLGWTFWFGCFCCLYGFARLACLRCENLIARYNTSKKEWLRFCIMIFTLCCGILLNLVFGLKHIFYLSDVIPDADFFGQSTSFVSTEDVSVEYSQIVHVLAYMISDSILVAALICRVSLTIAINALDDAPWTHRLFFFEKNRWLYYVILTSDILNFTLHFFNHVHMLIWTRVISLLTPIICVQIFITYGCLARRLRRHFTHLERIKVIRSEYPLERPVSSSGGCETELELCSICWEPLRSWRRLPCRHCFHEGCLTSWIEHDSSCPACRLQLLSHFSQRQRASRPNTIVGTFMRDLFNIFDSEPVELTVPPTADVPFPIRNVLVRLRSRGTPGFDFSVRVSLGPSRRLIRRPNQVVATGGDGQGNRIPTEPRRNIETHIDGQIHEEPLIQSTTRTRFYRFDGSYYSSWLPTIDIEFSETEQHMTSPGVTAQIGDQQTRLLTRFRQMTARHTPPRPLTGNLRAQGEQISAAFPDVPLNVILRDLTITQIPEVTVENILAGRLRRDADESEATHESIQSNTEQTTAEMTASTYTSTESPNEHSDSESNEHYPEPPPVEPQDIESMSPAELLAFRRRQLLYRARNRFNEVRQRPWNRDLQ